jgi:hypothetical protein
MKIVALLLAFILIGCTGDRLRASTKCDDVSAVMSNPSATRDQVAAWVGTTGALAHDGVALSDPLAQATPQATLPGHAKRMHHDAALAIVGLPCAECRYRSDACSKIRRNDLGT